MKKYYFFIAVVIVIGIVVVAWQSIASGPIRVDQALVDRIQATQNSITDYSSRNHRLPTALSELRVDHGGVEYEIVDDHTYKLCGNFLTSSRNQRSPSRPDLSYIDASNHDRGYQCFTGTVRFEPEPK